MGTTLYPLSWSSAPPASLERLEGRRVRVTLTISELQKHCATVPVAGESETEAEAMILPVTLRLRSLCALLVVHFLDCYTIHQEI